MDCCPVMDDGRRITSYACPRCGLICKHGLNWENHKKGHYHDYVDGLEPQIKIKSLDSLDLKVVCPMCLLQFKSSEVKTHMDKYQFFYKDIQEVCPMCLEEFSSAELQTHMAKYQFFYQDIQEVCPMCLGEFSSAELQTHMAKYQFFFHDIHEAECVPSYCFWIQKNMQENVYSSGIVYFPPYFPLLTNLENLNFSHNGLSGNIPGSFLSITSLQFLDLSEDSLSGPVSDNMFDNCGDSLCYLSLSGNFLEGAFPKTVSKCTSLNHL
ncbi:hypothetical protein CQW23_33547 [Capsicum baccatum]|uniref:C2H2-type domain-containing protein n=1 Tax=Capsicum baccatum TaxID=33114 RepID=A0A2G2V1H7_CAPBA|nr:hypothetical protein CQW23_33547 [Capsicum baccatum]